MRPLAIFFLFIFVAATGLRAQTFGSNFAPTLSYSESYVTTITPDGFGGFNEGASTTLVITAKASMQGVDLTSIDGTTEVILSCDELNFDDFLYDSDYPTGNGNTANFFFTDINDNNVGALRITWNQNVITFSLSVRNDSADYNVEAVDIATEDDPSDNGPYFDFPVVTLSFGANNLSDGNGPQTLGPTTLYVTGTVNMKSDDRIPDYVANIHLSGLIDSAPPTNVAITDPINKSTVFSPMIDVHGTADDALSGLSTVFLQVNGGPMISANINGVPNWVATGVSLIPGSNKLTVQATDNNGNTKAGAPVFVTYSSKSPLTVNAAGVAPGKVTSSLFKTINYVPAQASPTGTSTQEVGAKVKLTAVPGAGSFFAGWTSTSGLVPNADSASLTYSMTPNATLTANFIENPYPPFQGTYDGLIAGAAPSGNGFFTTTVNANGRFTGTIKIGKLSLPIKGGFNASQQFTGNFTLGGVTYTVTLALAGTGTGGAGQITGTITGPNGLNSSISSDVAGFKKKVNQIPASEVGAYNVILPPAQANSDPNFPAGISYGQVTISALGSAHFVGLLGDGTMISAGATLSQAKVWPFYASLYKSGGSISGPVTLDPTQTDTDLAGPLEWNRPAVVSAKPKPFAAGFGGNVDFTGAKWTPWHKSSGELIFLNPSNGQASFSLDAPAVAASNLPLVGNTDALVLNSNNTVTLTLSNPTAVPKIKVSIAPSTGLISGSFSDASNKSHSFSGIVVSTPGSTPKTNAAAGFFIWGTATGSMQIIAP